MKKLLIVMVIFSFALAGMATGEETDVQVTVTGHLQAKNDDGSYRPISGQPVYFWRYLIADPTALSAYGSVQSDSQGNYVFRPNQSSAHRLIVTPQEVDNEFNKVFSTPEARTVPLNVNSSDVDFTINPYVHGGIDYLSVPGTNYRADMGGTKIMVGNRVVDTIEESDNGRFGFCPSRLGLPSQGWISLHKNFHKFSPQDDQGIYIEYDVSNRVQQLVYPVQKISLDMGLPFEASWVTDDIIGHAIFPLTPDNRVPNNPNFFAEISFSPRDLDGVVPKEDVFLINSELGPLGALEDLTPENGYTTTFICPIPGCLFDDISVGIHTSVWQAGYMAPIPYSMRLSCNPWTVGTSDMDLDGNGVIGLGDNTVLAGCIGSCLGEEGYNPCADYVPGTDPCISLSDVVVFSTVFYMTPSKSLDQNDSTIEVHGALCFPGDTGCSGLSILSESPWDAALAEFSIVGATIDDLEWIPTLDFEERSALIENQGEKGRFGLFLFGNQVQGEVEIGQIVNKAEKSTSGFSLLSASAQSGKHNEGEIFTKTPSLSSRAFPNPFNPRVELVLDIPNQCKGTLAVYSIDGTLVRELHNGALSEGIQAFQWLGEDNMGRKVSSGTYFYRFVDDSGNSLNGKMVLLK